MVRKTSGSLSVDYYVVRSAPAVCVALSFGFKVSPANLDALKASTAPVEATRLDESILAYAAYGAVCEKLDGSAIAGSAAKILGSCCGGVDGGEFVMSFVTDRTLSAARKVLGVMLAQLKFSSLYTRYSTICATVGIKADKDAFNRAATEASRALNSAAHAVVIGRINISKEENLTKLAAICAKKISDSAPNDAGAARKSDEIAGLGAMPAVATASIGGLETSIVRDFLRVNVKRAKFWYLGGNICVAQKTAAKVANADLASAAQKFNEKLRGHDNLRGIVSLACARKCQAPLDAMGEGELRVDLPALITKVQKAFT